MKKFFMFLAVAGLMTFTANIASAQDEAAPAATEQVAADEPVTDLFAGSGEEVPLHQALKTKFIEGGAGFMSLVLICLILGLALAIERILYLSFSKVNTEKLVDKVSDYIKNGDIKGAMDLCKNTRGPIASIYYQGLKRVEEGQSIDAVEKAIVSYGSVENSRMEKGLGWISLFIAIAPSLGFLGTVIGMIQAFDAIQAAGDISPNVVAGGMKVALITTVGGLIVAVILQLFYNYILSKIDTLTIDMEDASIRLVDMIADKK
ncbi:MAG: MotA/TolQ/ExbB proton channel family protein [Bacteroidales bacterium]|nr:MotA/TolQ/ExbB proton channel family protein [Bacteroidales bacterium]